ncbi:ester cyclase [Geodermatophilus sp. SYSU D00758]
MSEAVFRAHIEQIWNAQDPAGIERFIARSYRGHDPAEPEVIVGVDGYKEHFRVLTTAFPDVRITIEETLGVADRVTARWFVEATHLGDFGGIPPTGARIRVQGISVVRITSRQLVEEHGITDALGLMKQLGVVPGTVRPPSLLF